MVSGSRIEGGTQILSAGVRKTIQSIKEIVGNHSDADIYNTLKETNMDPNETTQKLLNQDPFHEVKRKRDKKKEVTGYKGSSSVEPRKHAANVVGQGMILNINSDHNVRRGGFVRNALPGTGVNREFRVVRDNRVNQNVGREIKPPSAPSSLSKHEPVMSNFSENSSRGRSSNQKAPVRPHSSLSLNGTTTELHPTTRQAARNPNSGGSGRKKDILEEKPQPSVPNAMKLNDSTLVSSLNSGGAVVGVYSSSSDPVHVPSLDSRPAANVGAIKREVGARRHFSKNSSAQTGSFSNHPHSGRDAPAKEPFRSFTAAVSENVQPTQTTTVSESAMPVGRSFLNNQHHSSRPHQQIVPAHQKAPQPNKEWKPKSSQKPNIIGPGVIGAPVKSVSPPPADNNPKDFEAEAAAKLQDKFSRVKISENQNVIIASHIRVSETDRSRLTFGSLGADFDPSQDSELQPLGGAEDCIEPLASLSIAAPESSSVTSSGSKQGGLIDERVRNSGSNSPGSGAASEQEHADRKVSSSPQNMDSYADIGLVHDSNASYTPSESQLQQQDPPELPTFSAYDPQSGYDIRYFRPIDETVRGQALLSPQEDLSSHMVNSMPASTIAMVQQQQPQQQVSPVAQMYPQVHLSHFANLMPYRQFMYVPPMAMQGGYSSNPASYPPHPSNGSSYVLMPGPGGSSHLTTANGLKYGIQQFKPLPTGSATGFGNFTTPTGYTINSPGVVSGVTGIEDSSRLKYKDGNLYIPNPQAETSEIWMNPRDMPSMQSASYYNMAGQVPPHAAATYLPSHTGHHAASFNAAQSSHMQFPGLYHPQQPAAIASPHHLAQAMGGGNLGVAAATPGAQLGPYTTWTGNF